MERFDDSELNIVQQVIKSGELSRFFTDFKGGKRVQVFEKEFASYIGCKYAVSVSNGTAALEVALAAVGVKRGDKVITTPLSFIATGTAVLRMGALPIFVDIEKDTLNIDPDEIASGLNSCMKTLVKREKGVCYVLPASLNGMPCKMDDIMEIAEDHGAIVVEDACQSLGATYYGEKVGALAHASVFSFQETKTITTLGEGGMIVTDDPRFYERALNIRNHGNVYGTLNNVICTNARMTEAQAAFGIMQLRKLDSFVEIQTKNAEYFFKHLKSPFKPVYNYPLPKGIKPSYYLMPITGVNPESRHIFLDVCKEKGISKGVPGQNVGYYKKLMYQHPIFASRLREQPVCPNAEWARANVLLFDIHRWNRTCEDIDKALKLMEAA